MNKLIVECDICGVEEKVVLPGNTPRDIPEGWGRLEVWLNTRTKSKVPAADDAYETSINTTALFDSVQGCVACPICAEGVEEFLRNFFKRRIEVSEAEKTMTIDKDAFLNKEG